MSTLYYKVNRRLVRTIVRTMKVDHWSAATPGTLEVQASTGGRLLLTFDDMFALDSGKVWAGDGTDLFAVLEHMWPDQIDGRPIRRFGDGVSLCDMTAVLMDQPHALGLLQYGQIKGWWQLTYDMHVRCPHSAGGACAAYCAVAIAQLRPPSRRTKTRRRREPLLSRFNLGGLLPGRGIAIA